MSEPSREAVEAGVIAMNELVAAQPSSLHDRATAHASLVSVALAAALPFLERAWEDELLADEAISRAENYLDTCEGFWSRGAIKGVIRAALDRKEER